MKYVERPLHIEHHPENESDRRYLITSLGANPDGQWDFWCVARPVEEVVVDWNPRPWYADSRRIQRG